VPAWGRFQGTSWSGAGNGSGRGGPFGPELLLGSCCCVGLAVAAGKVTRLRRESIRSRSGSPTFSARGKRPSRRTRDHRRRFRARLTRSFGYRSGTNLVAVAARDAQAEHGCSAHHPRATQAPGPRPRSPPSSSSTRTAASTTMCQRRSCLQPSGSQLAVQTAAPTRPAPPWNHARAKCLASPRRGRRNSAGSGHPLPICNTSCPSEPLGKQRANSPRMCDENAGGSTETRAAAARLIAEPSWTLGGGGSDLRRRVSRRTAAARKPNPKPAGGRYRARPVGRMQVVTSGLLLRACCGDTVSRS
jgi:hypothetical protein